MKLRITENQMRSLLHEDDNEQKIWDLIESGQKANVEMAIMFAQTNGIDLQQGFKARGYDVLLDSPWIKGSTIPEIVESIFTAPTIQISGKKVKEQGVPKILLKLRACNDLRIMNAGLQQLPEWLGQMTWLESLILNDNRLSRLPDSFSNLTNLTELNVTSNAFDDVPEQILSMNNLQFLDLAHNQIYDVDEIEYLKQLPLKQLDLGGNGFSPDDEEEILEMFPKGVVIFD